MKISKEARRTARECFHEGLTNGRLDAQKIAKLSDLLIAAKPRGYVGILRELSRLVRLELDRRHAVIDSATQLSESERAEILKDLSGRFGSDLTTEFRTEPALLGGMRVKVGSDVWDGTIYNRLEQLKQTL